jgi:hypothetical protein
MEEAKSLPFDDVVNDTADAVADDNLALPACQNAPVSDAVPYPVEVQRSFRDILNFPYGTRRTVIDLDGPPVNTKQIQIIVRWEYRSECYTHSIISLRRR